MQQPWSSRIRAPLTLLAFLVVALGLSGCVCCSLSEYSGDCCSVCSTCCTETCIPLALDTIRGDGPANARAATLQAEHPAPVTVVDTTSEVAAVPY